jgi:hypothetical protein
MPIELRPRWCLDDETISEVLSLGDWANEAGARALDQDGDAWKPGETLVLRRDIEPLMDLFDMRRHLSLVAGQSVGVAARWSCGVTNNAGVHASGPTPVNLDGSITLVIEIPEHVGGSIEIETCLVIRWGTDQRPEGSSPDGALIWSDGWSQPPRERSILLEGDELRIPVRTVSFTDRYDSPAGSLWAIELDTTIELDDLLSNVVTVYLNDDVLRRDFAHSDGEPDPASIPGSLLTGVSSDLVRSLTATLIGELNDDRSWSELAEGTVGSMLVLRLTQAFGSAADGAEAYENDQPAFTRQLNDVFAPDTWRMTR